ncbi:CsbD family protein [Phreatobacter aquaticus]|uniref:CsbD family protein n=1 Tax=Phreatobacter aquaticus TaxID=2570229 RepID=A0A4D7QL11_9HYPH|nr:CsbD family protein [Phreatobacter aquaticus]QCK88400.1 CsbD family protein [Phreatobacter aquaticus]
MGSMSDKAKGIANEAAGNVRQAAGKAIGNTEMQVRGLAQEKKGEAQQAIGKAKDKVKDVVDKA